MTTPNSNGVVFSFVIKYNYIVISCEGFYNFDSLTVLIQSYTFNTISLFLCPITSYADLFISTMKTLWSFCAGQAS